MFQKKPYNKRHNKYHYHKYEKETFISKPLSKGYANPLHEGKIASEGLGIAFQI